MEIYTYTKKRNSHYKLAIFGFFILVIMMSSFTILQLISAPVFKSEKTITIPEGYSIIQTSQLLKKENLVHSALLTRLFMQYNELLPKSGPYYFKNSYTMMALVRRIADANYGDVYVTVTIPEGSTNNQLISAVKRSKIIIDESILREQIKGKEGYLFPDTYSFLPDASESDIIKKLEKTFSKKIQKAESGKTIEKTRKEIVIMASLIEKEAANNLEQKQIISGILWKRIRIGMLLQVDAPFLYERGKGSAQLSRADLKKDSLYNTYVHKGLTPTAIGNPGYDSLYAAAHPIQSEYLFYLHGSDGKVHYAKNHTEHVTNKQKYIK